MKSNGTTMDSTFRDPRSMTDPGDFMDSFVGSTRELIQAERSYITFLASRRLAETVHKVTGSLAAFVFYGLAVLIVSLGGALWLGRELNNVVLGFMCVGGGYVLIGLVFGALWKGALGKRFIVGLINSFHGHR